MAAMIGQRAGWGTLLTAGTRGGSLDGTIPPESIRIYGLVLGNYAVAFPPVIVGAILLPLLWVNIAAMRWIVPRILTRKPGEPQ